MEAINEYILNNVLVAWIIIVVAFTLLTKCADLFVEGAVALAEKLHISKIVIGIILVSVATSTPELAVSLSAALKGSPGMALGNAMGSVICDDGLALAAAGIMAGGVIFIEPLVLKTAGIFLLCIQALTFLFVGFDHALNFYEGLILVLLLTGYMGMVLRWHRKGRFKREALEDLEELEKEIPLSNKGMATYFILGLGGIILASQFIVVSAQSIALSFKIPDSVISMLLVALGTSIPEVATSITAVRKNHGALAFGNIIGSDIINICLVGGASAMANTLTIEPAQIYFMFTTMFIISLTMVLLVRHKYRITRTKGFILFGCYLAYLAASFILFPPQ